MLNSVNLTGRLTKDPELRYTPSGVAVGTFTLAVARPFTNDRGEKETDFLNCVVWRKTAETISNHVKKGSLIGVTGRLQSRSFEAQDGKRVFVTEVNVDQFTFLENKQGQQQTNQTQNNNNYNRYEG